MTDTIDYFFGIGSPWSYIGFDAFLALSGRFGVTVRPHVIPLIEENGGIYARNRPEVRRAYWFRDLKRWAALREKPLALENRAALSDPTPAGRLVVAAQIEGQDWIGLTRALQFAFWGEGKDIGNPAVRAIVVANVGFDPQALEAKAGDTQVQTALNASHQRAKAAGVFGIPTFLYQNELYWGQDSLPFLERHLAGHPLVA